MRKITLSLLAIVSVFTLNSQIVINEIMYNNPGADTLEFVELYNSTANPINLDGYEFIDRTSTYVFNASHIIPANGYFVLASDSVAFESATGVTPDLDLTGSWSFYNSTDTITVKDNIGNVVDIVGYDDNSPWPPTADGAGPSLELCSADSNNFDAQFWYVSTTVLASGVTGTPGAANSALCEVASNDPLPMYMISEIDGVNGTNEPDSLGVQCQITGIVHCGDFNGGNTLDFTVIQSSTENVGIKVYSSSTVDGYVVTEGDSLRLVGTVGFFRGMTQFNPDTIEVLSQANNTVDPLAITELNESTDSKHLVFENGYLATPSQWTSSGSFNVDVTNGTDTILVRLDSDVPLASEAAPTDTFDIFGLGGQYDTSSPYDSGYQFMACHLVVDSTDTTAPVNLLPTYLISEIDGINATNEPDSLGVNCQIYGVVHCIDFRGGDGLEFTILESSSTNIGIKSFSGGAVNGYTVTEGDSIRVEGSVSFFNGMTQFSPDSIELLAQNVGTVDPMVVTTLDESTESKLIAFENATLVTPSQWTGSGSGFNVDITDGANTIAMRIDNESPLYSQSAPTGTFDAIGLGGQYDSSSPYDSGYQLIACHIVADSSDTTNPEPTVLPTYLISEIDGVNATNEPDSLGVNCQIYGVVHCIDFRGGDGLEFTMMESSSTNIGIKLFNGGPLDGYEVTEGDSIRVEGSVSFFNGMTQFSPDSIELISQGNGTVEPLVVTELNESTDSKLVTFENATLVDPAEWTGSGSGFNVDITDGTNTIAMRIDNDSPLYSEAAPTEAFNVIGLGGQFDSSSPYDEGYQLIACSLTEVQDTTDTSSIFELNGIKFNIFPNPVTNIVNVEVESTDAFDVQIVNLAGKVVMTSKVEGSTQINVANLSAGFYSINLIGSNGIATSRLIKQ